MSWSLSFFTIIYFTSNSTKMHTILVIGHIQPLCTTTFQKLSHLFYAFTRGNRIILFDEQTLSVDHSQ